MIKAAQPIWFLKLASTAVVLVACCWAAPRWFTNIPQFPPTTTDELQFVVLDRYLQLPVRNITLVGSSLTFRLKEQFFEHGNVRNLAVPGGSALTGLALIKADNARHLKIVAIETNIFDRSVDTDLLQKINQRHQLDAVLRPLRSLAAFYQSTLDLNQPAFDAEKRRAVLSAPAVTRDHQKNINETLMAWNKQGYDRSIVKNADAAKAFVADLEAHGTSVFLYELPVSPALEQSHYLETIRKTLSGVFNLEGDRWLSLEYPAEELRWDDATHLDERSAILMSVSLENAINKKMTARHGADSQAHPE
jgi:hypothetical protein